MFSKCFPCFHGQNPVSKQFHRMMGGKERDSLCENKGWKHFENGMKTFGCLKENIDFGHRD